MVESLIAALEWLQSLREPIASQIGMLGKLTSQNCHKGSFGCGSPFWGANATGREASTCDIALTYSTSAKWS